MAIFSNGNRFNVNLGLVVAIVKSIFFLSSIRYTLTASYNRFISNHSDRFYPLLLYLFMFSPDLYNSIMLPWNVVEFLSLSIVTVFERKRFSIYLHSRTNLNIFAYCRTYINHTTKTTLEKREKEKHNERRIE